MELKQLTKSLTLPSGLEVEIKDSLTYGDQKAIFAEAMGDIIVGDTPQVTINQAQNMVGVTILRALVKWNLTEADKEVPITKENIELLSDDDVNFLMQEINKKKVTKGS